MSPHPRACFLLLATLPLVGCLSTSTPLERESESASDNPLPYRVALIPVSGAAYARLAHPERSQRSAGIDLAALQGDPDVPGDAFTSDLANALERGVFQSVCVLTQPSDGSVPSDRHWYDAARMAQADLLIEVDDVRYETHPRSRAIWSSYLFFLSGPLEMVFPDRRYRFDDTEVGLSIYDMTLLEFDTARAKSASAAPEGQDDENWLFPRQALLREMRVAAAKFSLRYGDRLGGRLGLMPVLKSFVVPTTHLANGTETSERRLSQFLSASLADEIATRIAEVEHIYIDRPNERVAAFHLVGRPEVRVADGRVEGIQVRFEASSDFQFDSGELLMPGEPKHVFAIVRKGDPEPASTSAVRATYEPISGSGNGIAVELTLDGSAAGVVDAAMGSGSAEPTPVASDGAQIVLQGSLDSGAVYRRSWTIPVRRSR